MATATVFSVFTEQAATGILAFLPRVAVREGGRRFFEVSVLIAATALALGQAARILAGGAALDGLGKGALGLSLGALALSVVALGVLRSAEFERAKPILLGGAGLGTLALLCEARDCDRGSTLPPLFALGAEVTGRGLLTAASLLAGAALLGSVTLAMVLGHFYLVIPRLTIEPLQRLTNGYTGAIAARTALAAAFFAIAWDVEVGDQGRSLLLDQTVLLLPRALFGIVGLLVLCVLARGTVAIKSTQSATGILYGATVFVVFGELAAAHLAVVAKLPI